MRDEPYSRAEDLKGLIDRLGLGRVALMGLSLGSGAASTSRLRIPTRFADRRRSIARRVQGPPR
jgi:pimeloyl-ACP methyl ester carboxylesterase